MSDASTPLEPNEIDDLLRKAQAAAGSPPAGRPPGADAVLAREELASLLGAGGARTSLSDASEGRIASGDMEFLLDQAQQALESVDRPAESDPLEGLAPF